MKEGIHPKYHEVEARCACGATWKTHSTKQELHLEGSLNVSTLLTLPGVVQNQNASFHGQEYAGAELRNSVLECVRQALETVLGMRRQEGMALETAIREYVRSIREKSVSVRDHLPFIGAEHRERLEERLKTDNQSIGMTEILHQVGQILK